MSTYAWIIDTDHLAAEDIAEGIDPLIGDGTGTTGPSTAPDALLEALTAGDGYRFTLYDDDAIPYYTPAGRSAHPARKAPTTSASARCATTGHRTPAVPSSPGRATPSGTASTDPMLLSGLTPLLGPIEAIPPLPATPLEGEHREHHRHHQPGRTCAAATD